MGNINIPPEWPDDFSDFYNDPLFIRYQQEMLLKGLAERTVKDYGRALKQFLMSFDASVESLTNDDIKTYLIELKEIGFSDSKIKISLAAIRHFWELALKREWTLHRAIKLNRKQTIPDSLSVDVVMMILNHVRLFRYRIVLYTLYCTGMRLDEGLNLRVEDIDTERMVLRVSKTKGGRPRTVPLSAPLLLSLRQYWKSHRNPKLVFPFLGRALRDLANVSTTTKPMARGGVQTAMRNAAKELRIAQQASPHILRHSYATHMLEYGINLRLIQIYLGHKSPSTTARYTHLSEASILQSQQALNKFTAGLRTDDIDKKSDPEE